MYINCALDESGLTLCWFVCCCCLRLADAVSKYTQARTTFILLPGVYAVANLTLPAPQMVIKGRDGASATTLDCAGGRCFDFSLGRYAPALVQGLTLRNARVRALFVPVFSFRACVSCRPASAFFPVVLIHVSLLASMHLIDTLIAPSLVIA